MWFEVEINVSTQVSPNHRVSTTIEGATEAESLDHAVCLVLAGVDMVDEVELDEDEEMFDCCDTPCDICDDVDDDFDDEFEEEDEEDLFIDDEGDEPETEPYQSPYESRSVRDVVRSGWGNISPEVVGQYTYSSVDQPVVPQEVEEAPVYRGYDELPPL